MKPTLKATTKTYIEVNYGDLDNFINACFPGARFKCVAKEEWSNYSKHSFSVAPFDPSSELDMKWGAADYARFKETKKTTGISLQEILCGMCTDGLIPAGEYLVSVFW